MPTQQQITEWFQRPKVQATIRASLMASGVLGDKLVHWGFPQADLGWLTEAAIYVLPFAAGYIWSLAVKTHERIIQEAAKLVAAGQASPKAQAAIVAATGQGVPGASVVVDPTEAAPAVRAVATDPAAPGVTQKETL